ncbi:23S rRNA (uracil(1939)-C(5))-methyltransferase RlmD [Trichlorobacter lovleyi]|uniref:23S rRNA (uracil(1939)-C(5))-methyltransferase RlmD n=1 Tax=Trichlorobacter lovleyi TaxID=313985 RepID=UPI00223F207E|nr:23S rRNA (uracil(1939)-C(5))-methyltransferase RlmD [Trichlorobacter lovleyi]QOX78934.1 23S rRNA (uracil(1939)-C(5))-methyltransferase RlmD [Trichlorobacter lovleyi]
MKPRIKTAGKGGAARQKPTGTREQEAPSGLRRGVAVDLLIERLDDEGIGSAHYQGRQILVAGTLPQDRCLARISHIGKTIVFADLVKLIEPSPLRLQRCPCSDAALCLGCPLIAMRYGEQLRWKQDLVQAAFNQYPPLKPIVVPRLLTPERRLQYRTTAKLAVAGSHADPYIGIYRRASHDVVDLEDCPLHHPMINTVIKVVREGISRLKVPVYQEKNKSGILRYLVVRVSESSNEVMVTFVTARRAFNEIHHLARFLQENVPQVAVVCQNINSSEGNVIFGAHDHFLTKQQTIQERIGQVELLVSPRSFLQAQNDGARLLYETARDWAGLDGSQQVLDLYCGIGGIALTLAPAARQVLGVELNKDAVADAKRNARLNNVRNCRFEAGDVLELLDDLLEDDLRFDCIVLNPPRKGCDQEVLDKVAEFAPERIVYVSCSPQTLARDLDILIGKGYDCLKVQPVEMFPQTPHVENVALLLRKELKTA